MNTGVAVSIELTLYQSALRLQAFDIGISHMLPTLEHSNGLLEC